MIIKSIFGLPPNERFDASYLGEPNSGCWFWVGATYVNKKTGYLTALFTADKRTIPAPRFSYERFVGSIPNGASICHKCNVSICVNPAHLYAGDHKSNAADLVRSARSKLFKLTPQQVRQILESKETGRTLARRFGVSANAISGVRRGKAWKILLAA